MMFCVSVATVGTIIVLLYTLRMEDASKYTAFPSSSTEVFSPPMQSLIWRKSGRSLFIAKLDVGTSLPRDKPPPHARRRPPTRGGYGYGYVLAQRYADQLTGGAVNVANLMCLATQLGRVRVVEPFLINSRFGLPVGQNWTSEPRFTDLYDATKWKEYGSSRNYSLLVPYETFLENAPRKVIIVQYSRLCDVNKVVKKAHYYCNSNGFEVVRNVCVTYGNEGILSTAAFKNQIYGQFKPKSVVVLFISYGGIHNKPLTKEKETHRLFVRCSKCSRQEHAMEDIEPSSSVYSDAETYIAKYLHGSSSYITLMIRVEYLMNQNKCFEVDCLRTCLNEVLRNLREVKNHTGLNTVFLAIDVGTFGSDILLRPEKKVIVTEPVEELLKEVFDNATSLHGWEKTFTTVGFGRTQSSGYIAMMQKVIAVKGDVLMLVGSRVGSSFQRTCRTLYHRIHFGEGQIIEPVPKCPPTKS